MTRPSPHIWILLLLISVTTYAESQEELNAFLIKPRVLSPARIQIDFDGDGTADKTLVTGLKGSATVLTKRVTLVHPWIYDKSGANVDNLSGGSKNNFYIVLSGSNTSYVIRDSNPISILDTEAAQELFAVKNGELAEMGLDEIQGKAKGDLLGIPTEAGIDTYLYWNGNTFISYEPLEVP